MPSLDDKRAEFVGALSAPISADAPTGEDVTYDDDFRVLKNTVDKLSTATDDLDLDVLAERSLKVLTEKSKDLRVGAYFVVGQTRVNGVTGMAASLDGLRAMMETHWDDLYPPTRRAAARGHALQFVADHLSPWVEDHSFTLDEADAVAVAAEAGTAVQSMAVEKLDEKHRPALSGLLSNLDRAAQRLKQRAEAQKPKEEPKPDASQDDGDGTSGRSEDEAAGPATGDVDTGRSRSGDGASGREATPDAQPAVAIRTSDGDVSDAESMRVVTQVATAMRKGDLSRIEPYRLLRTMRWGGLTSVPPNEGGKTQIAPPEAAQRTALTNLLDRDAYERLLEAGEQAFQSGGFHLWLDLQHLQARAAAQLGAPYAALADTLRAETATLLRRLPALPGLTFRDGTPFASAATQGWLETLQAGDDDGAAYGSGGGPDALDQAFQDARSALGSGSLDDALDRLSGTAAADAPADAGSGAPSSARPPEDSARTHFRRRLYTAMLCLDGGRPGVALPLLEALAADVDAFGLDRWEPDLALQAWNRLYTCYTRLHDPESDATDFRRPATAVYRNICRLNAQAALDLPEME